MDDSTDTAATLDEVLPAIAAAGIFPWVWDIQTGRVTWSPGIATLLGLERGTAIVPFDKYMQALPADERRVVSLAIDRALRGETPDYHVEHRVKGAHGSLRWVAMQGQVFRDAAGEPVRLAGVLWDITDRKEHEATLAHVNRQWAIVREINRHILHARSEPELFANVCRVAVDLGGFELAWIGVVTKDGARVEPVASHGRDVQYLDGLRVDVADTDFGKGPVARAVRLGTAQIVNDLDAEADPPRWHAAALARGHKSVGAFPLRRAGRVVGALGVSADARNAFDAEQLEMMVGLADDIDYVLNVLHGEDQHRLAVSALRSSEERYRAIFQQAFEGILTVTPAHQVIDANESACRMLGYAEAEILGLKAEQLIHPEDFARVPIRFASIPRGGVILTERRFLRKDGRIVDGEVSTKALEGGNFQVVVRDVTQRKQVQAQILLTDRLSSLGRLASGVAHELNNPLAYLMLNLEMLQGGLKRLRHPSDPNAVTRLLSGLDDARDGAERMRHIVRALSSFGRGDEERVGPVDVHAALDAAVEIASMQLRHRAKLTKRYGEVLPVSANSFRLGQVFLNLLVNAADALAEGNPDNEVVLSTHMREDGWIVVEVRDNGAGIPLDAQARIFDPFFTTKAVGSGTGLGLAVCHAIVTTVGGKITWESAPGFGTLFRVELRPSTPDPVSTPQGDALTAPTDEDVRGRVLIADDDPRVASAFASMLKMHEVVVVATGRAAIERARSERFDCILCDLMMPDLSGIEVHEALRRDGRGVERRIVFVTGGAVTEATRAGLADVDNRVLEKPVDSARLVSVVAAAVAEMVRLHPGQR